MDIEQLKLILQTVGDATESVKEVALFWVTIEMLKVVLSYVMGGAVLWVIYRALILIVEASDNKEWDRRIRDMVSPVGGRVSARERELVEQVIRRGLAADE